MQLRPGNQDSTRVLFYGTVRRSPEAQGIAHEPQGRIRHRWGQQHVHEGETRDVLGSLWGFPRQEKCTRCPNFVGISKYLGNYKRTKDAVFTSLGYFFENLKMLLS